MAPVWSCVPNTSARSGGKQGSSAQSRHGHPTNRRDGIMTYANRHHYTSDVEDQDEGGYDDQWPGRLPSSSYRYDRLTTTPGQSRYRVHPGQVQRAPIPARRSAQRLTEEPPAAPPRRRSSGWFRSHPLLWVGFGMLFMLLAWTGLQALSAWWTLHQED